MNYELIKDIQQLNAFIEFLPDLKEDEKFMISLFARKKYDTTGLLKSDKASLKRVLSDKQDIVKKIRQMEVVVGSFTTKDGLPIPQESLAVYITPNPRSMVQSAKHLVKVLVDKITENYANYNVSSLALSSAQVSVGTKHFMDFDFDDIVYDYTVFERLINLTATTVVKTRGGFHLLVHLDKIAPQFKKSWYQSVSNLPNCDVRGDCFLPIPGCTQGDFVPRFFNGEKYAN